MPSVPRDPEALEQVLSSALGITAQTPDGQKVSAYQGTLSLCWERMELLVGALGAKAIVQHSIRLSGHQQLLTSLITVDDTGLDFSAVAPEIAKGRVAEIREGLRALCVAILATLVELTGDVVAAPLLQELRYSSRGED